MSIELINKTFYDHHDDRSQLAAEEVEPNQDYRISFNGSDGFQYQEEDVEKSESAFHHEREKHPSTCATVDEMGAAFAGQGEEEASLRIRRMIHNHFSQHGAARARELPAGQFCRQNFVFDRSPEAGFGNEMYKILTAAALSLLLNRPLIIICCYHTHKQSNSPERNS
ncbi:hypothetical protein KI387_001809, partial [Taxus chinensis]